MPAWKGLEDIRKLQQANPGIVLKPIILGTAGEDNLAVIGLCRGRCAGFRPALPVPH